VHAAPYAVHHRLDLSLSQTRAEIEDPVNARGMASGDGPWVGDRLGVDRPGGDYEFSEDQRKDSVSLTPPTVTDYTRRRRESSRLAATPSRSGSWPTPYGTSGAFVEN
jgi:hypothetical protein